MSANAPNFRVPSEIRELADRSIDQSRRVFDGFLSATSQSVNAIHGQSGAADSTVARVAHSAVKHSETNMHAVFEHAQKLLRATNLQELVQLQSDFVKQQLTEMQSQMATFGEAFRSGIREVQSQTGDIAATAQASTKDTAAAQSATGQAKYKT